MWEDLIVSESGGKYSPSDLVWRPDQRVSASAFLSSGPFSTSQEHPLVGRTGVPVSYWMPVGSSAGKLCLRERLVRKTDDSSNRRSFEEHFGPVITWISPFSNPAAAGLGLPARDFTNALPPDYPICVPDSSNSAPALWDGFAYTLCTGMASPEATSPIIDLYFWDSLLAGPSTQLALALLAYDRLLSQNGPLDHIICGIRIDILTEVAKLRALRILVAHLNTVHGASEWKGVLLGVSSPTNLSAQDAENNMVRSTIAAIAALSGGVDSLSLQPWNVFSKAYSDPESALLSARVFDLLREESYLDQTWDPFSGAYSVETLTESLVQQSWDLFLALRLLSPTALRAKLFDDLIPADKLIFNQSGRRAKGKIERAVVGDTIYASKNKPISGSPALFPLNISSERLSSAAVGGQDQ